MENVQLWQAMTNEFKWPDPADLDMRYQNASRLVHSTINLFNPIGSTPKALIFQFCPICPEDWRVQIPLQYTPGNRLFDSKLSRCPLSEEPRLLCSRSIFRVLLEKGGTQLSPKLAQRRSLVTPQLQHTAKLPHVRSCRPRCSITTSHHLWWRVDPLRTRGSPVFSAHSRSIKYQPSPGTSMTLVALTSRSTQPLAWSPHNAVKTQRAATRTSSPGL